MLLASLGAFIVAQSSIAIIFGDNARILRHTTVSVGRDILGARMTSIQLMGVCGGLFLCGAVVVLVDFSLFGLAVRATANDQELARAIGINVDHISVRVMFVASCLAGFAGIVNGFDIALRPTMGFQPLMLGVVAMFAGGGRSLNRVIGASLVIAAAQQLAVMYLPSQWQDSLVFVILLIALLTRTFRMSSRLTGLSFAD
jgi:branched-chain amino acid transport system permease protein